MFGFGKSARAQKQLRSSLAMYIPGDRASQDAVLNKSAEATAEAARTIAGGGDPYKAGAMLIAHYIRAQIEALPVDTQHLLLRVIANAYIDSMPRWLRLAAHVSLDLARLETGKRPLVRPGTTGEFLDAVAESFSPQESVRKRIAGHLYACAAKIAEHNGKKTG